MLSNYLPQRINTGPWVPSYTLNRLQSLPADTEFILPICSLATPYSQIMSLGDVLLPPLFHEALDDDLRDQLCERILECFPVYQSGGNRNRIRFVDIPAAALPKKCAPNIVAFSVDTAVEEHGPHLPLGTDTIQSYTVLRQLASEFDGFELARPLEYGQLTWGLPFGFSIDITAELLTRYVTEYCNAIQGWLNPEAMYVVDVHGSITHRQAIVDGIRRSNARRWGFRWLHEPLAEFASARGDQHAGGVETILVEHASPALLDPDWWPDRLHEIAEHQMSFDKAVELTPDLRQFCDYVAAEKPNGVIGDITNYRRLNPDELMNRMLSVARSDVQQLISQNETKTQDAGRRLW